MRARPALGFWHYSHKHQIDLCTFNIITSAYPTWIRHYTQISHVFKFPEKLLLKELFSPLLCETMFWKFIPKPPGEALTWLSFLRVKNSSWRWGTIRDKNHWFKITTLNLPWESRKLQMDSNDKRFMVTNLEGKIKNQQSKQKRRGIGIKFLKPISLPAADHLLPGCLRWWAQKHFIWGAKVTPALGRRVGNRQKEKPWKWVNYSKENLSTYSSPSPSRSDRAARAGEGGTAQPCLPYSPCPCRLVLSSLSAGPRVLGKAQPEHRRSRIPDLPISSAGAQHREALLPGPSTALQQHSAPGSFVPPVLQGLAFWGDVFMHNCPAKSNFCSLFLWNQRGCHHIVDGFQWHFQACPDLDQMYLVELLAFYFKHVYLFFLQIKSAH